MTELENLSKHLEAQRRYWRKLRSLPLVHWNGTGAELMEKSVGYEARELDRRVKFSMSHELLIDLLTMPCDTIVHSIRKTNNGHFEFIVSNPMLPVVEQGVGAPEVTPTISYHQWEWNIDNGN